MYALIILLPLAGLLLSVVSGGPLELFGWMVPLPAITGPAGLDIWETSHNVLLPALFHVSVAMHLIGVVKNHFIARRTQDFRRMLRQARAGSEGIV